MERAPLKLVDLAAARQAVEDASRDAIVKRLDEIRAQAAAGEYSAIAFAATCADDGIVTTYKIGAKSSRLATMAAAVSLLMRLNEDSETA